ncbi:MAG: hypothetical protein C0611_01310 [Desulfobacteraceae bacterium]|jgi:hypothetical protein|nr:MAG: hypothetical protein C0611_01310 [Desulfobacteraceae bacterium]
MTLSNETKNKMAAYHSGPFEDLTIQEALTIIAVYAAQMDPKKCEDDVKRIVATAERFPEFVAKKESIFSFVNKFINSMQAIDSQKAVEIAANGLTTELRKTAFKLAAEVALPDKVLTDKKKSVLDSLESKLSISSEFAQKTIEKFIA